MKMLINRKVVAFSLIEAVVSLGITVVVMTAMVSASRVAQQNAKITVSASEAEQLVEDGVNMVLAYKKANDTETYSNLFNTVVGSELFYIFYPNKNGGSTQCYQKDAGNCILPTQIPESDGGGSLAVGLCRFDSSGGGIYASDLGFSIGYSPCGSGASEKVLFKESGGLMNAYIMAQKVRGDFGFVGELIALRNFASNNGSRYFAVSALTPVNSHTQSVNLDNLEDFSLYYRSMSLEKQSVGHVLRVRVQNKVDKKISFEKEISLPD